MKKVIAYRLTFRYLYFVLSILDPPETWVNQRAEATSEEPSMSCLVLILEGMRVMEIK